MAGLPTGKSEGLAAWFGKCGCRDCMCMCMRMCVGVSGVGWGGDCHHAAHHPHVSHVLPHRRYVGCVAGYQCRIWVPTFQGIFTIPEVSSVIGHEQGHNNYFMHAARNDTYWDEYGGEGLGGAEIGHAGGPLCLHMLPEPSPRPQTTPASWATTGWGSTGSTW